MVNQTQAFTLGGCLCCTATILFVILFPLAWRTLEPTEFGISINSITGNVDLENIYEGGRYHVGIGRKFIKFPRILKIIDFSGDEDPGAYSLSAGTSDKQTISLEVSLYYRIKKDKVRDIYVDFGESYESTLILRAQNTLKNVATQFSTTDYFTRRQDISDKMLTEVTNELKKAHVEVQLLQLRDIGLPSGLEQSLITKVVAQQARRTAELTRQVNRIKAQTSVVNSGYDANVTEINGNAQADAAFVIASSRADGSRLVADIEQSQYPLLATSLNLTSSQVLQFMWATRTLARAADANKTTTMIGFGGDTAPLLNFAAKDAFNKN